MPLWRLTPTHSSYAGLEARCSMRSFGSLIRRRSTSRSLWGVNRRQAKRDPRDTRILATERCRTVFFASPGAASSTFGPFPLPPPATPYPTYGVPSTGPLNLLARAAPQMQIRRGNSAGTSACLGRRGRRSVDGLSVRPGGRRELRTPKVGGEMG
jgi:hypothetical protein